MTYGSPIAQIYLRTREQPHADRAKSPAWARYWARSSRTPTNGNMLWLRF